MLSKYICICPICYCILSSPDLYCEKKPWSKIEFSYQDLVKLFHQKEPPKAGHQLVLDLSTEELTQIPPWKIKQNKYGKNGNSKGFVIILAVNGR